MAVEQRQLFLEFLFLHVNLKQLVGQLYSHLSTFWQFFSHNLLKKLETIFEAVPED